MGATNDAATRAGASAPVPEKLAELRDRVEQLTKQRDALAGWRRDGVPPDHLQPALIEALGEHELQRERWRKMGGADRHEREPPEPEPAPPPRTRASAPLPRGRL